MKAPKSIPSRNRPPVLISQTQINAALDARKGLVGCSMDELSARASTVTEVLRKCMNQPLRPSCLGK